MKNLSRSLVILSVLLILTVFPVYSFGDEAPAWLTQLKSLSVPTYDKDVNGVVLLNETTANVAPDGKVTTVRTFAVKILNKEGRSEAIARQLYLVSSSKVKDFKAWLIRPEGLVKSYGKDETVDLISDPDDIYNEYRIKVINAMSDSDTGAIFGYQASVEESPMFNQDIAFLQTDLPSLLSRYTVNLPSGWKANGTPINTDVEPKVSGSSYTWELRDLAPIADEPASPSYKNIVPHVAVNYGPENDTSFKTFKDWTEVSRWHTQLSNPSLIVDDAVAAKAQDLTASTASELEKIYAIGTYVQNLQYISIDVGVGRGNGYIPRPSTLVLSRGYGDCKDKANLMRAMLKAQKIDAYLVSIYSGDPDFVRDGWPSPLQFNHCIIAVKISDQTKVPTAVTHPTLGRLMIFDPTDQFTPVGDLPEYLQGSLALIAAGDEGKLMKMPVTPPEANKLDRVTELVLDGSGNLSGVIKERSVGQSAASERRLRRALSPADYNKRIEQWIVNGISTARLSKIAPVDKNSEGRFELDVEFNAPSYAQLMQGRLLVFKPAVVGRLNFLWLTDPKRTHPVVLDSNAFSETSVIKLPAGFVVDEMPDPVNLNTPFGTYSTSYQVKDDKLIFSRHLVMNTAKIAPDKYSTVQDFFVKIRNAEQAPVVLMKK